ncbi:benzil reductase ((S)-benzoin forming) [Caldalkalibacillus uzonensis]|uniref:Benzil reductase ((S)-benzoin forming) n=1 Tax=Caldalkalibacillus uzonensis TaxID=353224 RepID=A0ABU0CM35_9BACI|nr:(S)-benzoin forming benzil reductase [Caldalkalibacillus uzonensis]MDQ0337479.1 benzil reductase ((S)-benzoin forming) [Caldalkalibacillus uzonensis]
MKYVIITGASRGLGEALTRQLLQEGHHLFCISRRKNETLLEEAQKKNVALEYFEYDLQNLDGLEKLMEHIFDQIDLSRAKTIALINNAGIVEPVKPIEKCPTDELTANIHVNLLAPMVLTSLFVKLADRFNGDKRIMNISSGAGKRAVHGWSAYCTSKAGLDLFTRCVGLEQEGQTNPVKVLSVAPGIIDTDMQTNIRSTQQEDFPDVERFIEYKVQGQLMSPAFVAEKLICLFFEEQWPQGGVVDIRDYL